MDYVPILAPRALRTAAGIELRLRSPLSRAVPLSVVTLTVRIDDREIAPTEMSFCVNDTDFALGRMPALHDESWFTIDPARIRISLPDVSERHAVEVELGVRLPFIPVVDGVVVRRVERGVVEICDEAGSR